MKVKKFGDKKITIREISKSDLKNAKKFQAHINSLIIEGAKLLMNKKVTEKDEIEAINRWLTAIKKKTRVQLIAEFENKIIGTTDIDLDRWNRNHIGKFGIAITKDFRGIGLGKFLTSEIIKLAKKKLKPSPKIIQLEVYENNKPAIALYKKMGFKIVGKIPKQIQWKGKLIAEYIMLKYL